VEHPVSNDKEIDIPKIVEVSDGLYEDVSDLNGIALPSIYYDLIRGNTDGINILKDMIQQNLQDSKPGSHAFLKQAVNDIPDVCETAADYLFLANVYVAVQERLYFKLKQIDRNGYNWLTMETVNKCMSCLKASIPEEECKTSEIEKQLIHHSQESEHSKIDATLYPNFGNETKFRFTGRVDLLTDSTIWELKCTSQITMDHKMQVVIYMWLWRILYESESQQKKEFKILNIRTGEQLFINATMEDLTRVVVALLRNKYGKPEKQTDEEFVANCREYILADTIFY
jgi:hypothetical protein